MLSYPNSYNLGFCLSLDPQHLLFNFSESKTLLFISGSREITAQTGRCSGTIVICLKTIRSFKYVCLRKSKWLLKVKLCTKKIVFPFSEHAPSKGERVRGDFGSSSDRAGKSGERKRRTSKQTQGDDEKSVARGNFQTRTVGKDRGKRKCCYAKQRAFPSYVKGHSNNTRHSRGGEGGFRKVSCKLYFAF